ncbi:STAS domain-containing protein [Pullulanibacillus sp. KACC 23026]|uniref:STAS domain-containing protein n=1 Tax=Pullulanibacillus sp. KACC 23026 TaxID=3028315 RepID=UPI0023AECC4C|nr:STAS domain-containing protein [Pullulanibacillus sp. KACC 23026]WEG12462.1 STAS domain-containing protein [Pullulanibacillus sp. KACC 23026]
MLQYKLRKEEDHLVIAFEGDLDIEATELFNDEIKPLIGDFLSVNLNLSQVPFVDSSGMGLLIDLARTIKTYEKKLTISEVEESVFEVFELLQLPDILGRETFI